MNRIFHARIAWYQYFLLVVLTVNAVGALWCKYILVAVLFMLMLIVVIEQIIHTTYTLTTNGDLEVSRGRFIRKKIIPLSEITAVRKYHSMKFGRFSVTDYILIEYGKGKFVSDACQGTGICRTTRKENVRKENKGHRGNRLCRLSSG